MSISIYCDIFEIFIIFLFLNITTKSDYTKKLYSENESDKQKTDFNLIIKKKMNQYITMCKRIKHFKDEFIKRYQKYSDKKKMLDLLLDKLNLQRNIIKDKITALKNTSSPRSVTHSTSQKNKLSQLCKERDEIFSKIQNMKKKLEIYIRIDNELQIIKSLPIKFPPEPSLYLVNIINDIYNLIIEISNNFKLKIDTRLKIYQQCFHTFNFDINKDQHSHEKSITKIKKILVSKKLTDKLNKFTNENEKKRYILFKSLYDDIQIFLGSTLSK